tara:strand:+ start:13838 stop:14311 length:474 start_codon:yes stop_codon:yes gene_type:complete
MIYLISATIILWITVCILIGNSFYQDKQLEKLKQDYFKLFAQTEHVKLAERNTFDYAFDNIAQVRQQIRDLNVDERLGHLTKSILDVKTDMKIAFEQENEYIESRIDDVRREFGAKDVLPFKEIVKPAQCYLPDVTDDEYTVKWTTNQEQYGNKEDK